MDWHEAENIVRNITAGQKVPGSGNGILKGDVYSDEFLVEVKFTTRQTIRIHRRWFRQVALQTMRTPVVAAFCMPLGKNKTFDATFYVGQPITDVVQHDWTTCIGTSETLPDELLAYRHRWTKHLYEDFRLYAGN